MGIEFKIIHKVILDFLNDEVNPELEIIGSWYFRFLESDKEKFSLHLPYYTNELAQLSFNYIRAFTVVYNLINQEITTELDGKCLFNVFAKSKHQNMDALTLDFQEKRGNLALWQNNTITKLNTFLPVFDKKELIDFKEPNTIKKTFELFKTIRANKIIETPVLIDLNEIILSFNNTHDYNNQLISEKQFFVKDIPDNSSFDDSAMEIEEDFKNKKINNRIAVKYPYSKMPHPYLMDVGKKKFNLIFKNRFAYYEILDDEIFLLKNETTLSNQIKITIINTNHSKDLYDLFKQFKIQWDGLELNKYTTPFPKYWFLFLNPSLSKADWLIQFKKDFPAVAEKPIIKVVEKIIIEVIGLKWIDEQITSSTKLLFPELISFRKKRLEVVFENFKNYIKTINSNSAFVKTLDTNNYKNVIVLDAFNIIDLANKNQCANNQTINIVLPDYLYFGYQPWIKYHLLDYQFKPILEGLRLDLDHGFDIKKEEILKLKKEVIKEITTELKEYRKKYELEEIEEIDSIDEISTLEDIEYSNDEEIDVTNSKSVIIRHSVIINQNSLDEITIPSNEEVLVQKDTLIYVNAGSLNKGDFYIRNNDLLELLKHSGLYDKLVNIPELVLRYQNELFKIGKVYETLKSKGISYQHQAYFDNTYLVQEFKKEHFRIPRRKKDWIIICEFLNSCNSFQKISHSIQNLAFVAYYGRERQNELKEMYKKIINLLIQNDWIGAIDNPTVVLQISNVVQTYNHIFNSNNKVETTEISESIISTILDQLNFTEIKTINTVENE